MINLLDGKALAGKIRAQLKEEVESLYTNLQSKPKLAVILVGEDPASKVYVKNKSKACSEVGIEFEEFNLKENTSMEELLNLIDNLNNRKEINGILLQVPLPKHLDENKAFEKILPQKDVDGFNPINMGRLMIGTDCFIPCTPYGIMKLLEEYKVNIESANVVVVGRSNIVGKPLAQTLLNKSATVTICHSKTKNLADITKSADILISAVGKANVITKDMVKENAVVIDVGINRNDEGKLVGDVDFYEVGKIASYITPVPGGVGPMTIAMLMSNCIKAWKIQNNIIRS